MRHGQHRENSMTSLGVHEFLAMCHLLATRLFTEAQQTKDIYVYSSEMGRTLEMRSLLKSVLSGCSIHISPPHPYLNPVEGLSDLFQKIPGCPRYGDGVIPFWSKLDLNDLPPETESWTRVRERSLSVMDHIQREARGMLNGDLSIFLYHGGVIEPMLESRFGFQLTDLPSATMILIYELGKTTKTKSYSYELVSPYGPMDWAARKEQGEQDMD